MLPHARLLVLFAFVCWPAPGHAQYTASGDPTRSLDVPFVPTPTEVVDSMLKLARIQEGDLVYDLGSGDGRLVIMAAQRYGARGLGVDLDPARVAEARAKAAEADLGGRVQFKQGDLFEVDLRPADVLTLYLLPDVNLKLRPRILEQLRPGARVVSHDFNMDDWQPDAWNQIGNHMVYLWVVPAKVAGVWRWEGGEADARRSYRMKVAQSFQKLTGSLDGGAPARTSPAPALRDLTLEGNQISFTVIEPREGGAQSAFYRGTVKRDVIVGSVQVQSGQTAADLPWRAVLERR